MDGKNININSLIQEYYKWKSKITNSINSSQIILYSEDYCICEESFINEFEDLLKNYMNRKNYNPNIGIQFPKIDKIFINNFNQIISKLQNNIKLRLINLSTINIMYNKNAQQNLPVVKFYAGNKRIIIEFKENKDNKALLLINSLEQNQFDYKDKAYIIKINKEQKMNIFKLILMAKNIYDLLPELIENGIASSILNKGIVGAEIYLNKKINNKIGNKNSNTLNNNYNKTNSSKKQSNMNQNNENIIYKKDEDDYKENILKVLTYIFYFEKNITENKEEGFNLEEKYYLINQKWLNNYLENYDYSKVLQILKNLVQNKSKINYNNISLYIKSFANTLAKKNLINFNKEKSADLGNINNIFAIEDNINYEKFSNCYIIPSKIIELIKNNEFPNANIENNLKNIYYQNNNIFFTSNKNIIIGNLNEKLFIPKYILSYYNQGIFESEKNYLLNDSVFLENYLKSRNCDINNGKKQDLVFNNFSIGYIIFLNKNEKTFENYFSSYNENIIINKDRDKLKLKFKNNNIEGKINLYDYDKMSDTLILYREENKEKKIGIYWPNQKPKTIICNEFISDSSVLNKIMLIPCYPAYEKQSVLLFIDKEIHLIQIYKSIEYPKIINLLDEFKNNKIQFEELQFIIYFDSLLILKFDNSKKIWIGKLFSLSLEDDSLFDLIKEIKIDEESCEPKFSFTEMKENKYLFSFYIKENIPQIDFWEINVTGRKLVK